ncbi:FAD-dependent monooxygenase [Nocardia macrotermitis]|uniref:Anhydrotetracycline monooxygenase n=1 Tax=Nocardia macrotermitis TaxID=2585198 RepID=A0A7K0D7Y8_9NOCA|nr:FAD-dependent monooxygenase [Nocardia macrotermitis]MQY21689.1 Anhydrotetracycline monooxygenase [Nocardia macrotermitis]
MRSDNPMSQVIIAGAGPTGLTLAAELRRGGIDVLLLEQRSHRSVDGSRAAGMQPRTLEMLDQRGIADRFLAEGPPAPDLSSFAGITVDYSALPSRFPYLLNIFQADAERLLEDVAAELGAPVRWSTVVTGVEQDATGVDVAVDGPAGPATLRGSYLVACDGGRSTIRKLTGVAFPGTDATTVSLTGDVELDDPPPRRLFLDRRELGTISAMQFRPGWFRVQTSESERRAAPDAPVTIEELRASARRVAGTDFGMHSPRWLSHFNDATRQVERYRIGRVLLAGDAAHIHFPYGGQGMNMGMQDAFNLGWKLAAVLRGEAAAALLDTYHEERHAVGAATLKLTRAQSVLLGPGEPVSELHAVFTRLIGMNEVNAYLAATLSGLDIRYSGTGTHPLLGRRVPDAEIDTGSETATIHRLMRSAKPVLLHLSGEATFADAVAGWTERITIVTATTTAPWALADGSTVAAPSAVLIRPDGYIAWVSEGAPDLEALREALTIWCGVADRTGQLPSLSRQ